MGFIKGVANNGCLIVLLEEWEIVLLILYFILMVKNINYSIMKEIITCMEEKMVSIKKFGM